MLTNENGNGMIMPVSPMNNGGYGGFDGGWVSWIILFLIFGLFGNGGFGGFNGGGMNYDFPWIMNNTNSGFNQQATQSAISGLQSSVISGFGDVQLGIAGVNQQICSTGNSIIQQMSANEMAGLNRSFAEQTANQQGFNALQSQLAQYFCDNRLATVQTQNVMQTEGAATRNAIAQGIQSISDKLCQLELDNYKRENENLRTQLNMAALTSSQNAQTAQIEAGQRALANEIEAFVKPPINPSYNVPNPYAYCQNASAIF